jgi:uncharacterized integral membrane protein
MPRREENSAQTNSKQGNMWWIPLIIGFMMLFIPGGLYASPVMFLIAIIMRRRKSKESPETPHSLLPLINITP